MEALYQTKTIFCLCYNCRKEEPLKISVDVQVTRQGSDILGNFKVTVHGRNIVRIFPFLLQSLGLGWRATITHNQQNFFTFQESEDEEAMFRQTDGLPQGKLILLDLMNQAQDSATDQIQTELVEKAAKSGLQPFCESHLEAGDWAAEAYEAVCAELFSLPESIAVWLPVPEQAVRVGSSNVIN